jgi:hypothetical protein
MRLLISSFLFLASLAIAAELEFPLTYDSKPQPDVPKGTMIKDSYTAKEGSVFPGTQREHQICLPAAFMVAWHRPDRFRSVFTGVGIYVSIHGADQLPVLVRKFELKPLRVFLQSSTGDNNLYCGDW